MKARDIRTIAGTELGDRIEDLRREYFTLQEAIRLGKDRNHARLRQLRRDIARYLGVLREGR